MSALLNWTSPTLFNSFFADIDGSQDDSFCPKVDIEETETSFLFKFDLPGMEKNDIDVEVKDRSLVVSGERKISEQEKKKGFRRFERSFGRFQRRFQLPLEVDMESIQGHYKNGVLEIILTKRPEAKAKKINLLG